MIDASDSSIEVLTAQGDDDKVNDLTVEQTDAAKKSFSSRSTGLMLSHQFCIDVEGKRIAFNIITPHRFTDEEFLILLRDIISRMTGIRISIYRVFAHFSLIESSWLDNSKKTIIIRSGKKWADKYKIIEEEQLHAVPQEEKQLLATLEDNSTKPKNKRDLLNNFITRCEADTLKTASVKTIERIKSEKERTKRREKADNIKGVPFLKLDNIEYGIPHTVRKFKRTYLQFCDTMDLYPGSLSNAAESCGFGKFELSSGVIANMDTYKETDFEDFCRYGVRDAIVTAGIAVDIHSRFSGLGLAFQPRISKYSESYFKDFYKKNYATYGDWRELLGQVKGYEDNRETWMPNSVQSDVLDHWYHGGRNEVKRVGCFGEAFYWDLKSAYPTAVIMLYKDYNFSKSNRYWGDDAIKAIAKLRKLGPFQPHGVTVYCEFKADVIPIFPVSESGSIIFPQLFHGVVCWPEFWTAIELNLLKFYTIIHLDTFEALPERKLPSDMKRLLVKRREDKLLYKNLLNFNYGKTVQGVAKRQGYSSISCPALGAYMTSVCRAAVGELANLNKDYYGITTDGFISPQRHLKLGALNKLVAEELRGIGYKWIELEGHGTDSFFIKTRGYALLNNLVGIPSHKKKNFKKANMGVQAKDINHLIRQLNAGSGVKTSFAGFSTLLPGEIASMGSKNFTIDTTFDFKHMPIAGSIKETSFTIGSETLTIPSFDTRPIRDSHEYRHLRQLAKIRVHRKKFLAMQKVGLNEKEIADLLTAHALTDPTTRRILWEFRKGLARRFSPLESIKLTTWKRLQHSKLIKLPLYKVTGNIELADLDWLYDTELRVVKDTTKRSSLKKKILADLQQRYTEIKSSKAENTTDDDDDQLE